MNLGVQKGTRSRLISVPEKVPGTGNPPALEILEILIQGEIPGKRVADIDHEHCRLGLSLPSILRQNHSKGPCSNR